MNWLRANVLVPRWMLLFSLACFWTGWFIHDADAAVVEVKVHANRDGYAKLHTEGIQVVGCTQVDMGRCEWRTGTGHSYTTRRVKVHAGSNKIRLKAFRFEDVPAERLDYGWLSSSDPDKVPQQAAVLTEPAPFNFARVSGVVAGREIEPKMVRR